MRINIAAQGALALALVVVGSCKSEEKKTAASGATVKELASDGGIAARGDMAGSAGAAGNTGAAGSAGAAVSAGQASAIQLGAGETYYGGAITSTNLVDWTVADGTVIRLAVVNTGNDGKGHTTGMLRAYHDARAHDVQAYVLSDEAAWAELSALPDGHARFRYGATGEGRHARNALFLGWDASARQVRLVKHWSGAAKDPEPAWLASGKYETVPEAMDLCVKVLTRVVSCGNDAAFREALFRKETDVTRARMEARFDADIAKWRSSDEAALQCKRWGSDEYVDTHFSDVARLQQFADDTKLDCPFFGREIDDDGGLPRLVTDQPSAIN